MAKLPDLSLPSKQKQKATGTDGSVVDGAYKKLTKKPYFDCNQMSSIVPIKTNKKLDTEQSVEKDKSLQMSDLGTETERMSLDGTGRKTNTPGRARTCDLRIRNPLW